MTRATPTRRISCENAAKENMGGCKCEPWPTSAVRAVSLSFNIVARTGIWFFICIFLPYLNALVDRIINKHHCCKKEQKCTQCLTFLRQLTHRTWRKLIWCLLLLISGWLGKLKGSLSWGKKNASGPIKYKMTSMLLKDIVEPFGACGIWLLLKWCRLDFLIP